MTFQTILRQKRTFMNVLDFKGSIKNLQVLDAMVAKYGNEFSVSIRNIASELGISRETFRYHLLQLEKHGLISVERKHTRKLVCRISKDNMNALDIWKQN